MGEIKEQLKNKLGQHTFLKEPHQQKNDFWIIGSKTI